MGSTNIKPVYCNFDTPTASKIWNSLPPHILQSQTLDSFRHHLKTYYFQSAYPAPSANLQYTLILF